MTSSPMRRRLRIASSWSIAPSPSQKKIDARAQVSSTVRIFGITVFGVPRDDAHLVDLLLEGAEEVGRS